MLSFFPRDVLDEIWDLIEPVSEGFSTYFNISILLSFWGRAGQPVLFSDFLNDLKDLFFNG